MEGGSLAIVNATNLDWVREENPFAYEMRTWDKYFPGIIRAGKLSLQGDRVNHC